MTFSGHIFGHIKMTDYVCGAFMNRQNIWPSNSIPIHQVRNLPMIPISTSGCKYAKVL